MEQSEYDQLNVLEDRQLYDFVTETDTSQRKWVEIHLREMRRNNVLTQAAKSAARAAWFAAAIAGVSAVVAWRAYSHR